MLTLLIEPDENGYSVTEDAAALRTEIKGGQNRYRRDVLNQTMTVSVQFSLNPTDFQYLRAFYNVTNKGTDAFIANLLIETADLREYICNVKPGTWKLNKVDGNLYVVRMTLEVQPNDNGLDYAAIVSGYTPFTWTAPPPPADFGGE